tara:strand:+ start:3874 stop:4716 length:843 start_codon:yes stop_codon:yes gene_type:complete
MKIVECPRDAMQGISHFIPTSKKIKYINQLLKVGFDTIDFGSFVSPKVIPQLKDTSEVLAGLDLQNTNSKLLAIIANLRGAINACDFKEIYYLGFPLSISNNFQKRNSNQTVDASLEIVEEIQSLVYKHNKKLVVYISMAFGNPYGEHYHPDIVAELVDKLHKLQVRVVSLSDTIGVSEPKNIKPLFSTLINEYPLIEFGAHFHTTKDKWKEKVTSAYENGCRRFDAAMKGYGGCPMAKEKLTGNMPTENIVSYFSKELTLNMKEFNKALGVTNSIFKSI